MVYEVNTNVAALNVYNNLGVHQTKAAGALSKISSGLKAAGGLDIASQGVAATINSKYQLNQTEVSGVQNAINTLNVADQVYGELIALAQKGLEVANRAADANADTSATTAQLAKIDAALDSIIDNAQFNGTAVLGTALAPNVGGSAFTVTPAATTDIAGSSIANFNTFIEAVVDDRAENAAQLAALQNILQVLNSSATNMLAGLGQAQDTDIAKEMMTLTSANIMTEAATAMLAQAMQLPNSVLKLLQ